MIVSLIVAASDNDVIGREGALPWRLPDELRHFKATTMGHHVVVGRKTWQSIGRALPGRTWIVVSRDRAFSAEGAVVVHDFDDAIAHAANAGDDEVFVAGGGDLFRVALPYADRIWLTRVHVHIDGDATFPTLDLDGWRGHVVLEHPADERHAFSFTIHRLERDRAPAATR